MKREATQDEERQQAFEEMNEMFPIPVQFQFLLLFMSVLSNLLLPFLDAGLGHFYGYVYKKMNRSEEMTAKMDLIDFVLVSIHNLVMLHITLHIATERVHKYFKVSAVLLITSVSLSIHHALGVFYLQWTDFSQTIFIFTRLLSLVVLPITSINTFFLSIRFFLVRNFQPERVFEKYKGDDEYLIIYGSEGSTTNRN